jgi:hypothetical protein
MLKLKMILMVICITLTRLSIQTLPANKIRYDYLHVSTEFQHKLNIDIASSFSADSDVTAVMISCGEINLLRMAINSFFHFNTLVLRRYIVVDYCEL